MKYLIYIISASIFFASCSKDEEEEEAGMGPEPQIAFVSLSPDTVINFKNSVTLIISYKDNNGDLGFENPDVYALAVKDSRLDLEDWYHEPPLAPT